MSLKQVWVKKCEPQRKSGRSRGPAHQRSSHNAGSAKGGADGVGNFNAPSPSSLAVFELPQEGLAADELQASYGTTQKHKTGGSDSINSPAASTSLQISKDKTPSAQGTAKNVSGKRKKKRELLSKANAAGTTSGLYMASKTPELNQVVEIAVTSPGIDGKLMPSGDVDKKISVKEEDIRGKSEPNDWEEAAEIFSPNLEASEKSEEKYHRKDHEKHDSESIGRKRYTRDFLITLLEQQKELTPGFEIGADIPNYILEIPVNASSVANRETVHLSGGSLLYGQPSGPHPEHRGSSHLEEDKRGKVAVPFLSAQMGLAHGVAAVGRTNHGAKLGALKNPRGQPIGLSVSGVLSGPVHSLAFPSGMSKLSAEADRWQHANSVQKDLIPSPHTAMVVMHKAEKRNEGLAADELQASYGTTQKHKTGGSDSINSPAASTSLQISKDKTPSAQGTAKNVSGKRKKKRELLSKANAAGTTSGLYMASKTPELNQVVEIAVTSPGIDGKLMPSGDVDKKISVKEEDIRGKSEPNDWEEAAEIFSPNLEASEKSEEKYHRKDHEHDSESIGRKRYTRDFLITLLEQHKELTPGFEIGADIPNYILEIPVNVSSVANRETVHLSGGSLLDGQPSGPHPEHRGSSHLEEDKKGKVAVPFVSAQMGLSRGVAAGRRTNQGGKLGSLKNPRGQPIGLSVSGVLSGPVHSLAFPSGMSKLSAEADRWQHDNSVQKDLIPSPHTAMVVMHKAEKRNEVGKVPDKEEAMQRKLQAILNKLETQNFEILFMEVKEAGIGSVVTLRGVISQIFDEALMEPTFCETYANFCFHLARTLPDMVEDNKKITFKRLLLNKCQEEIERGEREQAEACKNEEDGVAKQTEEDRVEQQLKSHRRMLGNIRLMGELYKKKMLRERIMHECIKKLLGQFDYPDEEDLEALCKLMSTIVAVIDHPMAKEHMDAYFDRMQKLSTSEKISSRVRSMLSDTINLRKNKRRRQKKVERPKKMEEVHRDAAQYRQAQAGKTARSSSMGSSTG